MIILPAWFVRVGALSYMGGLALKLAGARFCGMPVYLCL